MSFLVFFNRFSEALKGAVKGFVHSLAVDFSAYDPNNYAKSLRIYAKEEDSIRGFEEFGTGEQQVLLMAFVKAKIGSVKTPKHIEVWEDLPRSKVGKVLKAEIKSKILG